VYAMLSRLEQSKHAPNNRDKAKWNVGKLVTIAKLALCICENAASGFPLEQTANQVLNYDFKSVEHSQNS